MIRRILLVVLIVYTAFACALAQPEKAIEIASEIIENVYETKQLPGIAVAVAKGHDWVWTTSFGYANIEDSVKIDPGTSIFRIGSVSKTLTVAGLMQLQERGKINLDAEIQEYVPEFPQKEYPVTVREIALHVGGIRHYNGMEFLSNVHYTSVIEGLAIFVNDPLKFEPGTKYSYSSYGWNLISAAMETASETEFLTYMHDNVFVVCNMKSTYPDDATSVITNRVSFYEIGRKPSIPVDNSYKWAGGGFLSTATDLVRFSQNILDNTLIRSETLEIALEPYTLVNGKTTNRGIGFEVDEDKHGRSWIGHGGGSLGGTSMLIIYPKEELIVVVLANQTGAGVRNLTFKIADTYLNN